MWQILYILGKIPSSKILLAIYMESEFDNRPKPVTSHEVYQAMSTITEEIEGKNTNDVSIKRALQTKNSQLEKSLAFQKVVYNVQRVLQETAYALPMRKDQTAQILTIHNP